MLYKKSVFAASLSVFFGLLWGSVSSHPLVNEKAEVTANVNAQQYFQKVKQLPGSAVLTDPHKLLTVAKNSLNYLEQHPQDPAVTAGLFQELGYDLNDAKNTLKKIIHTIESDTQAKRSQRVLDPRWLEQNFQLMHWSADTVGAKSHNVKMVDKRLRITKYVVFSSAGSPVKTAQFNTALYALPADEAQLSNEEAEAKKTALTRYRYTKQDAVNGKLDALGVKPLVWLPRQGLEDALMQGSLMVTMPDGKQRMFNVHRNNGIGYDRSQSNPWLQRRYWYFKEVAGILGYGNDDKVVVEPTVTFAGDVFNLGLGKVVAMRYLQQGKPVIRLGVLADTGGAFLPNLYQLDYLAGLFPSRAAYQKGVAHLPTYADTYILMAR